MKKCVKCGRELPLNFFRECKTSKDGHRNDCKDCEKRYREEHKEMQRERVRKFRRTHPIKKRANELLQNYKREDKKYNRGQGDLTAEWIMENIFTKPCAHCGIEGWNVIGCNRIDNDLPHTKDNVEPCCRECNHKLALPYISSIRSKPCDQIDSSTGEIISHWKSANDAAKKLGFTMSKIIYCCNGGYFDNRRNKWVNSNTYRKFVWKRCLQQNEG